MKCYNLYYNNEKINLHPITKEEFKNDILPHKYIYKQINKKLQKIDIKNIDVVETTVI